MRLAAARRPPARRRRVLRNGRDLQSLAYMVALPALAAWQWIYGLHWLPYGLMLFLTLGIGVVHHNHAHLRMWRRRAANRATDMALTLLQGHPTFVFFPAHAGNHHRHKHGARDLARTYRYGGDTNHLLGYLLHPLQAAWTLYPLFWRWLGRLRRHRPGAWRYCLWQYAAWLGLWGGLLAANPGKALVLVILPQLHGLHWLLATNYLQHAHTDGGPQRHARLSYARNFEGLVNPLLFNIGLHTAHHEHARAHWSELTRLHARHYRHRLDPALVEPGLVPYMLRVFVLGLAWPRCRSRTLMRPEHIVQD
ncbi:fatty acid desaturase [Bordetella sp. BOR01]|uniref:fatty acid desaturase n=1 Tax=Bordetella sp. BOR01 TaxID=2854779 RepID=UPI001C4586BF|nr:fatty acid desaturase [Bordetella sp. BOR01]MBV7485416.1 fatty acid desaturase [Bordetella sp. BOR01]